MKLEKMLPEENKIQDTLNKVISEEMIANMFYHCAVLIMQPDEVYKVYDMFKTIADDELFDHHKELCKYAVCNGYTIPIQEKEYKKFSDKEQWKIFDSLTKNKEAKYYIEQAINLEKFAIKSYEKILEIDELPYDLNAILQKNYYDELQHLEDLNTLKIADDASAILTWSNSYDTANMIQNIYWW